MGSGFYKEEVLYIYIYTHAKALKLLTVKDLEQRAKGPTHIRFGRITQFIYVGIVSGLWLDPTQIACHCNVRAHNESYRFMRSHICG
jgi:hypothetical protein